MRTDRGFTLTDLMALMLAMGLLLALLLPAMANVRQKSVEERCADNLRQIGMAIQLYGSDNQRIGAPYPRAHYRPNAPLILDSRGADLTAVAGSKNEPFSNAQRDAAEGVGFNNIPAALFLLLRTQPISSDVFVCPGSEAQRDGFIRGGQQRTLEQCGNFAGDDPERVNASRVTGHLSYGYANPYVTTTAMSRGFRMALGGNPEFAVMADMGPGEHGESDPWATRDPGAPAEVLRRMNSDNHGKRGQNVLFGDGRVAWVETPFAGPRMNNIYVPDTDSVGGVSDPTRRSFNGTDRETPPASRTANAQTPIDAVDSVILPWAR